MESRWDQPELERYIEDQEEEGQYLEYKAAPSLDKSDDKKKAEITKDVSAMANAGGGMLIYGIAEYGVPNKRHLPQKLDPIDRMQFSKEWLEQVINSGIRPRIDGLVIHPVDLDTGPTDVAYVVTIPQSMTAHQARNLKYYRRYNFEVLAMYDHEIRDVMHRGVLPDIVAEFGYTREIAADGTHHYRLTVEVRNEGFVMTNDFKLEFSFPNYAPGISTSNISSYNHPYFGRVSTSKDESNDLVVTFRSNEKLFPKDSIDVGAIIQLSYWINDESYAAIRRMRQERGVLYLRWRVYADNMPFKTGEKPFNELYSY